MLLCFGSPESKSDDEGGESWAAMKASRFMAALLSEWFETGHLQ